MTFLLTLVSVLYFGILTLIGGGVQLFQAFKCTGWKGVLFHVLIGLLYVVAGIMIVTRPLLASLVLTWMLASILIAVGVLRLVMAIQHGAMAGLGLGVLRGRGHGTAGPHDPGPVAARRPLGDRVVPRRRADRQWLVRDLSRAGGPRGGPGHGGSSSLKVTRASVQPTALPVRSSC